MFQMTGYEDFFTWTAKATLGGRRKSTNVNERPDGSTSLTHIN